MKAHSQLFLALAMAAKSRVHEITPEELRDQLSQSQKIYLIDVREDSEWQTGYIPGAIHLCKGVLERDIEKVIPDSTSPVVLYCSGGYRSAIAADNLQNMGYKNVASMLGGLTAWQKLGFVIENPI